MFSKRPDTLVVRVSVIVETGKTSCISPHYAVGCIILVDLCMLGISPATEILRVLADLQQLQLQPGGAADGQCGDSVLQRGAVHAAENRPQHPVALTGSAAGRGQCGQESNVF